MPNLTQDYANFINQAIVELPSASDAGIRQALFEVMHEFFEETLAWQETISVPIVANTTTYTLVPAEAGEFLQVISLLNTKNTPQPFSADLVGVITLRDTPNSADTWSATIAKTVGLPLGKDGTPIIPEWTISRWRTVLSAGLFGRLMMQSRKPYTNPTTGQYWLRRFRNRMGNVKSALAHGNQFGANRWRFPGSYSTRTQRGGNGSDQAFGGD